MALAAANPRAVKGRAKPRLAPPTPARSEYKELVALAADLGIIYMPWQETSARYTEAQAPDGRHLYPEVCEVVSRQQGKTEKFVPLVVKRLRAGRRIMHTAQNRDLPREVFGRVADIISQESGMFRERNGRAIRPRFANGQEEIVLANGGRYKIVAPTRGGARGGTNDDVLIDELREMDTWEFIGAAKPTMTASPDPQIIYESNAGDDSSIVLNSIRERAGVDPRLAYLEWSAAPERDAGDKVGWLEANPAIGHIPTMLEYLEGEYLSHKLGGTLNIFETEHLCRWVPTMRERLVDEQAWTACRADDLGIPRRAVLAVSMDPDRTRVSAAVAWQDDQNRTCLRLVLDGTGSPIPTGPVGEDLRRLVSQYGIRRVAYDPMTDAELAKFFVKPEKVTGNLFANHSSTFVELVASGKLRWDSADAVTADLMWTAKKEHEETGTYQAVRAKDDRPITASLAAIRAVGLASGPQPIRPKVM